MAEIFTVFLPANHGSVLFSKFMLLISYKYIDYFLEIESAFLNFLAGIIESSSQLALSSH